MKLWFCLVCGALSLALCIPSSWAQGEEGPTGGNDPAGDEELGISAEVYAMFMHACSLGGKDADEAEKVFLAVIARDPDAAFVYYKLAQLYRREGDIEKSLENFERAFQKDPKLKEAYISYAVIKRSNGDRKGAIETYESAVKNIEDNLDLYKILADTYAFENELEKALATWERAAEEHPGEAEPWINTIKLNLALGESSGADAAYEEALEKTGGSNRFLEGVRSVYARNGNDDKAEEITLKLIQNRPNSARLWIDHIRFLLRKEKTEEARKAYSEAAAHLGHRADFFVDVGELFEERGDAETAAAVYEEGLKTKRRNLGLLLALAALHEKQGETEKARQLYEGILRLRPDSTEYYWRIAEILEREKLYEKALETYQKTKEKLPKSKKLRGRIIDLLIRMGKLDEAEKEFEELISLYPKETGIQIDYIILLNAVGKYDKAGELASELLEQSPNPILMLQISTSYVGKKEYDKAAEYFEQAIKSLEEVPAPDYVRLALLYRKAGNDAKAKTYFDKVIVLYEDELAEKGDDYKTLYALGAIHETIGEQEKAIEYFEKAADEIKKSMDDNEDNVSLVVQYADLMQKLDRYDEAEKYYLVAIDKDPEQATALYALGAIHERMNEDQEARGYFERAADEIKKSMDDNEDDVSLVVQYADLMQKLERYDEAEKYYLVAIDKDPEQATALNNLGYMWIERGEKLSKAIKLIERALEIEPDNSAFIDSLGWGLFKKGKYKDALAKLKEAVEAGANDPVVFDHLGDAYMKNKMYEEAIANWEKAIEMEHEHPDEIRQKIEETRKRLEE